MIERGYLIVVDTDRDWPVSPLNPRYLGVGRVPTYPPRHPEETHAMDEYVFGDYKDPDHNWIPDLRKAQELLSLFAESPRRLSIIFCQASKERLLDPETQSPGFLGFDLAELGGDYWSIIGDYPVHVEMQPFTARLNDNGLFDSWDTANEYLLAYKRLKLPEHGTASFLPIAVHQIGCLTTWGLLKAPIKPVEDRE